MKDKNQKRNKNLRLHLLGVVREMSVALWGRKGESTTREEQNLESVALGVVNEVFDVGIFFRNDD